MARSVSAERRSKAGLAAIVAVLAGCAGSQPAPNVAESRHEVMAAERAFARTMADRDLKSFSSHVAEDAVFFSGPTPLHGRTQVTEYWSRYFKDAAAPFSWDPSTVEVLESGMLALSTGPVRDPAGKEIATFTSIWRRGDDGRWQVVFDKGTNACQCAAAQ